MFYMNIHTGSVGNYDSWFYYNEDGTLVNAVDLGEVVKVTLDDSQTWIEYEAMSFSPNVWKIKEIVLERA